MAWNEGTCSLTNFNKIRIRDDDVLVSSSGRAGNEFARFKGFHNMVLMDPRHFIHVPAILVREIQEFPECIQYVREETAAGRMLPEIHGWEHKDYAALTPEAIVKEIGDAQDFIEDQFNYTPKFWYSPHGAGSDARGAHLKWAAEELGLTLVTCENVIKPSALVFDVRAVAGKDRSTGHTPMPQTMTKEQLLAKWEGREIFRHWWEGMGALTESIRWFQDNV